MTLCAHCGNEFESTLSTHSGRQKFCSEFCMMNSKDRKNHRNKRNAVLALLGDKCVRCGFSDRRALQIDHVHAQGRSKMRESGGNQYKMWNEILAGTYSVPVQCLCANCNIIKRIENKEHGPRTKKR